MENKLKKKYCLTRLRDGVYQEVSSDDFEEFVRLCPVIVQLLEDPDMINEIHVPKSNDLNVPLYDNWDKAAKRLINTLWRQNAAKIFHKPVDPDRLGIPDYFEIVKDPIDLGTIK